MIGAGARAFGAPAWDCHVHVFGDRTRYPLAPDRPYTPGTATVEQVRALHGRLGLERAVLVQPSPYGADNACLLDAIRELGGAARGVAVLGSDADLAVLHGAGVRGARVNLASHGRGDPQEAAALLRETATRVAPLGWHVDLHAGLETIAALAGAIAGLGTSVVIDHFGLARAGDGVGHPGFAALLELVAGADVYVKLSAPDRLSTDPDDAEVATLARALIAARPDRMLWGSDWPHTGLTARSPAARDATEPFRAVDDAAALRRLAALTGAASELRGIMVDNPARLYGV